MQHFHKQSTMDPAQHNKRTHLNSFSSYRDVPLNQTRLHIQQKKSYQISINKQKFRAPNIFINLSLFLLVNNAINPKISRARRRKILPAMKYHFSFILLKAFVERIFLWCKRRENFNKLFAADSRLNDAFSTRKKISVHLTKKTHKKISFVFVAILLWNPMKLFLSRFFFWWRKINIEDPWTFGLFTFYVWFFSGWRSFFVQPRLHDDFIELVCVSFPSHLSPSTSLIFVTDF